MIVSLALAALLLPGQALASVRVVQFTGRVAAGDDATLTVKVAPAARCTITVVYDTTISHARGLAAKRGGTITWRWRVGTSTNPGRWPVVVDCGKSGKVKRLLQVV